MRQDAFLHFPSGRKDGPSSPVDPKERILDLQLQVILRETYRSLLDRPKTRDETQVERSDTVPHT